MMKDQSLYRDIADGSRLDLECVDFMSCKKEKRVNEGWRGLYHGHSFIFSTSGRS